MPPHQHSRVHREEIRQRLTACKAEKKENSLDSWKESFILKSEWIFQDCLKLVPCRDTLTEIHGIDFSDWVVEIWNISKTSELGLTPTLVNESDIERG